MLKRLSPLFAAVLLACVTCTVNAQSDPAELRCGAMGGSSDEVERCLRQALAEAERLLAQAQTELEQTLRDAQPRFEQLKDTAMAAIEQAMRRAQQAWGEFFDRNCGYYGELHRVIGEENLEQLSCQLRMVRARTAELQQDAKFWREKAPAMSEP